MSEEPSPRRAPDRRPVDGDWAALYQAHAPRLRRLAHAIVGAGDVDDVVQEAFLRAYRNRRSIDADQPVGPWLNVIVRRAAIDLLRQRRVAARSIAHITQPAWVEDPVEESFFNDVRRAGIEQAMRGLNPRHRRLLGRAELSTAADEQRNEGDSATRSALARARLAFRRRYLNLTEESGIFGSAAVATRAITIRMRSLGARTQDILAQHQTALWAACLGMVLASAAVAPAARVHAGKAIVSSGIARGSSTAAEGRSPSSVGIGELRRSRSAGFVAVPPSTARGDDRRDVSRVATNRVTLGWSAGSDGRTGHFALEVTVVLGDERSTTASDTDIDCVNHRAGTLACDLLGPAYGATASYGVGDASVTVDGPRDTR